MRSRLVGWVLLNLFSSKESYVDADLLNQGLWFQTFVVVFICLAAGQGRDIVKPF